MPVRDLIQSLGLSIHRFASVSGGDINSAYCLYDHEQRYFLKVNAADAYPDMFRKEIKGLETLQKNCSLTVPAVIASGKYGKDQYLLLEWLDRGQPQSDFWEHFGTALANMHAKEQAYFGFEEDNFIGSLPQCNTKHNTWSEFYAVTRLLPLAQQLHSSGLFTREDLIQMEQLCKRLPDLFPEEKPSLLHGDLWSGNFMINSKGHAAIYDPAVYYGHREMDLGMSKLFGGFDALFYEAYHAAYPLHGNWQERVPLTQLYPLLVHAVLFGAGYAASVKNILKKFI